MKNKILIYFVSMLMIGSVVFNGCSFAKQIPSDSSDNQGNSKLIFNSNSSNKSDSSKSLNSDIGSSTFNQNSSENVSGITSQNSANINSNTNNSNQASSKYVSSQSLDIKTYTPNINEVSGYDDNITGKNIFVTYDDGPSVNNTPIVLDTMKKYNIKATFFVCGPDTAERRALIKRAFDEGHAIGIHCYSHYLRSLYKSETSFFADFDKIEKMVIKATGKKPNLYRFPGGTNNGYISRDLSKKIIIKLKAMGYEYYDWNVSSFDSNSPPINEIASTVIKQCKKRINTKTPSIILLHDSSSRSNTAHASDIIFKELKEAGFYFAPLSHTVKPIHFVK